MLFDTHAHLNFDRFKGQVDDVIKASLEVGVTKLVVPGTDIKSSIKAVEIAGEYENVYAAVGIHPHHIYEYHRIEAEEREEKLSGDLAEIEKLLSEKKVVAVGEAGIDRYYYRDTKYSKYQIDTEFITLQKKALGLQIKLAVKHGKSLILHNRQAKEDLLSVLRETWSQELVGKTVVHCCEPEVALLDFVKEKQIFLGVDGDVTYSKSKAEFIKNVPLEYLVLETDSPFLLPEPLRSEENSRRAEPSGRRPNTPANIPLIAQFVAELKGIEAAEVAETTTQNANSLFSLQS